MVQNKYYYSQGFRFSRSISVVDFIQTLNEVRVVPGVRTKIYFKPGTTSSDFEGLDLPSTISVDTERELSPKRNLNLKAKKMMFNTHLIYLYDLDDRVVNYIVAKGEETALMEDGRSTTWVINSETADNCEDLTKIIESSKYVFWGSIPEGEYYSYKYSNTASAASVDTDPQDPTSTISSYTSNNNVALDFNTYTKWRLEYATVLLGFYESISTQVEGYSIYMDGKPIQCLDKNNTRRIDLSLEGFGNLSRHPYVLEHDLYQTKAELSLKIQTPDQLEYMHLKKKYQNYEFLTDIVTFEVDDKQGLPWTNHIWWEPYRDNASFRSAKDAEGRFSFTMELRCSIHFYEVEDEMFQTIEQIRVCFANLPEKPEYVIKLTDF